MVITHTASTKIAKALPVLHRLGTACGGRPAPQGVIRRRKAPRAQRSMNLFAGIHARRPFKAAAHPVRRQCAAAGCAPLGAIAIGLDFRGRRREYQALVATVARHEVSGPRRSGSTAWFERSSNASPSSVLLGGPWPSKARLAGSSIRRGRCEGNRKRPPRSGHDGDRLATRRPPLHAEPSWARERSHARWAGFESF